MPNHPSSCRFSLSVTVTTNVHTCCNKQQRLSVLSLPAKSMLGSGSVRAHEGASCPSWDMSAVKKEERSTAPKRVVIHGGRREGQEGAGKERQGGTAAGRGETAGGVPA